MQPSKRAILQYLDENTIIEHMMYYTNEELVIMDYLFDNIEYLEKQQYQNSIIMEIDNIFLQTKLGNKPTYDTIIEKLTRRLLFRYTIFRNANYGFEKALALFNRIELLPNVLQIEIANIYYPIIQDIKQKHPGKRWHYVLRLNSSVAAKMYAFLLKYLDKGSLEISIADLKTELHLNHKYKNTQNFKQRIIETGVREVNQSTDLHINFTELGVGTKHMYFEIQSCIL